MAGLPASSQSPSLQSSLPAIQPEIVLKMQHAPARPIRDSCVALGVKSSLHNRVLQPLSVITPFYASSSLAASSLCSSPSHQNHSWFSPKGNSLYLWPFAVLLPLPGGPSPPILSCSSEVSPPLTAFCELQLRLISHPLCSPRAPHTSRITSAETASMLSANPLAQNLEKFRIMSTYIHHCS